MKWPAGLMALGGLAVCSPLPAQVPHEHGVASLDVMVGGDLLELRLRAPLQSLAGLETPPRTDKQRQAVRRMATTLHDANALFEPTAAAGCGNAAVTLSAEVLAPALLAAPGAAAAADVRAPAGAPAARKPAPPAHADLEAQVTFRCAKPTALTGLQVRLFDAFPALREIRVAIVTPRGDSGVRLSPSRTSLTW